MPSPPNLRPTIGYADTSLPTSAISSRQVRPTTGSLDTQRVNRVRLVQQGALSHCQPPNGCVCGRCHVRNVQVPMSLPPLPFILSSPPLARPSALAWSFPPPS